MAVEDTTRTTIQELQKVLSANNIIGAPVEMEDKNNHSHHEDGDGLRNRVES